MKIAIAQLNYTIGDIDGNTSKIIDSINKAKARHADLVIFAEQAVSGTPAFDLLRKTTFLELCEDALVEIASCCDGIAAIVGLPILTTNGTISAAALIQEQLGAVGIRVDVTAAAWSGETNAYATALEAGGFDLALVGTKGTWYDHKVSVSNPEPAGEEQAAQ